MDVTRDELLTTLHRVNAPNGLIVNTDHPTADGEPTCVMLGFTSLADALRLLFSVGRLTALVGITTELATDLVADEVDGVVRVVLPHLHVIDAETAPDEPGSDDEDSTEEVERSTPEAVAS